MKKIIKRHKRALDSQRAYDKYPENSFPPFFCKTWNATFKQYANWVLLLKTPQTLKSVSISRAWDLSLIINIKKCYKTFAIWIVPWPLPQWTNQTFLKTFQLVYFPIQVVATKKNLILPWFTVVFHIRSYRLLIYQSMQFYASKPSLCRLPPLEQDASQGCSPDLCAPHISAACCSIVRFV